MHISATHIAAIYQHVATSQNEVCGVLIGQRTPQLEVNEVVPGRNLHPQPQHHFLLDAASLLRADTIASANGQAIIGFYHSHPNGTAIPSGNDRRDAWPDAIMLIVASNNLRPRYCCGWLLRDGRLLPEPTQII